MFRCKSNKFFWQLFLLIFNSWLLLLYHLLLHSRLIIIFCKMVLEVIIINVVDIHVFDVLHEIRFFFFLISYRKFSLNKDCPTCSNINFFPLIQILYCTNVLISIIVILINRTSFDIGLQTFLIYLRSVFIIIFIIFVSIVIIEMLLSVSFNLPHRVSHQFT